MLAKRQCTQPVHLTELWLPEQVRVTGHTVHVELIDVRRAPLPPCQPRGGIPACHDSSAVSSSSSSSPTLLPSPQQRVAKLPHAWLWRSANRDSPTSLCAAAQSRAGSPAARRPATPLAIAGACCGKGGDKADDPALVRLLVLVRPQRHSRVMIPHDNSKAVDVHPKYVHVLRPFPRGQPLPRCLSVPLLDVPQNFHLLQNFHQAPQPCPVCDRVRPRPPPSGHALI